MQCRREAGNNLSLCQKTQQTYSFIVDRLDIGTHNAHLPLLEPIIEMKPIGGVEV